MSGPKKNGPICFFCFKNFLPLSPCERSAPRACWIFQQFGLWKLGQFQLLSQHRLQTIGPWQLFGMPRMIQGGTNLRSRRKHHFHKTRTNKHTICRCSGNVIPKFHGKEMSWNTPIFFQKAPALPGLHDQVPKVLPNVPLVPGVLGGLSEDSKIPPTGRSSAP